MNNNRIIKKIKEINQLRKYYIFSYPKTNQQSEEVNMRIKELQKKLEIFEHSN